MRGWVHGAVAAVAATLFAMAGVGTAAAEPPVDDHIHHAVANGLEVARSVTYDATHPWYINEIFPDLPVTVDVGAIGIIRTPGTQTPSVIVTVLRLASEEEAGLGLAAMTEAMPPGVEQLPPLAPHTALRRVGEAAEPVVIEAVRATGRDLIVFAEVVDSAAPSAMLVAAFQAHVAAFPKVTPPAGAATSPPWVLIATGLGALAAAVVAVVRPGRGPRPTSPAWRTGRAPSRPAPPFEAEPWTASPRRPRPPG